MNNTQKTPEQLIDEQISELQSLPYNDFIQAQNEYREIEPLLLSLGLDLTNVKRRHGLPIDFELKYKDKNIAIEVTDVRPYLENYKIAKKATEDVVEEVIRNVITEDTVSYFQIDIILKEKAYRAKRLKTNFEFQKEVQEFLHSGSCGKSQYIESFSKRNYPGVNIPKRDLSFNFQYEGFLTKVPSLCIYNAITNKEEKLIGYKTLYGDSFDEYWLCIGLPLEERGYSINGSNLESDFESGYQRIYITQQLPHKTILLYSK